MTPCSICACVACSSETMFKIAISARTPPPCAATTLSAVSELYQLADAVSELAVTLAAGRREIPLVELARTQHAGVSWRMGRFDAAGDRDAAISISLASTS